MSPHKNKILSVDLEPAPYKYDLWNAFARSAAFEIKVIYSRQKDWSPDGGHDYQNYPNTYFDYYTFSGNSLISKLHCFFQVLKDIYKWRPNYLFISGYVDFVPLLTIIICVLTRHKYLLHSDIFNCDNPSGSLPRIKRIIRDLIRRIVFYTASGILVCGRLGHTSAIAAGCPVNKIIDFPYVVDVQRMLADNPGLVPSDCKVDLNNEATIVLFCGRMIERKGLDTLLKAAATINNVDGFMIWIEGDGPLLNQYKEEAKTLGVKDKCRFLGFCQMDLHSWLLRNSDIVVVPSNQDSWGIVVDEGMQHGKAVISADAVGSGVDRLNNESNGLIFPKGNHDVLSHLLRQVIVDKEYRSKLGKEAIKNRIAFGPIYNVNNLSKLINDIK